MKKYKLIKYILIGIAGVVIPCLVVIVISMIIYGANYPMVKIHYWKGFVEQRNGNLADAIKYYDKATELDKHYPTAYISRGSAYYEIDSLPKSLEDYNKAIQLNKSYGYAYSNRALLKYTKLQDFDGACQDLKTASKLGDEDAKEHLKDGICD